jgi:DNA-binding transcriptional MerR regulator
MATEPEYLTTAEFAELARASESTVRYWRHVGYGVMGFRVGRRILYDRAECVEWLRSLRAAEVRTA